MTEPIRDPFAGLASSTHVNLDLAMTFEVLDQVPDHVQDLCRRRAVELEQEPKARYAPYEALQLLIDGEAAGASLGELFESGFLLGMWPSSQQP